MKLHILLLILISFIFISCGIKPQQSPVVFSICYDANAADGGLAPTDKTEYDSGYIVTVLGNPGNLTKNLFSFVGWNTKPDGTGTTFSQGQTFRMGTADVILYACWSLNPTYSITYDGNGNTGGSVPTDTTNYQVGQYATIQPVDSSFVRNYYTFTGWNTATDGSGTHYSIGSVFAMPSHDIVLYAEWSKNKTYKISYDGNGALSGTAPNDSTNYESGSSAHILNNTGNFAKAHYAFAGWNTKADGTGASFQPGASTTVYENITLYALWTIVYTVTYDGNGNTDGDVPVDPVKYYTGQQATILGNTGTLVKENETFIGWNTKADGSGDMYQAGVKIVVTDDIVLFARWSPSYTITYAVDLTQMAGIDLKAGNDPNIIGTLPEDTTGYLFGQTAKVSPVYLEANSRNSKKSTNHYTLSFSCWNDKPDGSGKNYLGNDTITVSDNVTLYAQFGTKALEQYYDYLGSSYRLGDVSSTITEDVIIIPAYYNGLPIESIFSNAFHGYADNTRLVIGDNIKTIHAFAFYASEAGHKISYLKLGRSLQTIGEDAFWRFSSITELVLPESLTKIDNFAFYGATNLNSITFANTNISLGVRTFAYSAVSEINIPSAVLYGCVFEGCPNLEKVTLGKDVSVNNGLYPPFDLCPKLATIEIDPANPYLTTDGQALYDINKTVCMQYIYANPSTDYIMPSTVTTMGLQSFTGVPALESLLLSPNLETINVGIRGTAITSLQIPSGCHGVCQGSLRSNPLLTSFTMENGGNSWIKVIDEAVYDSTGSVIIAYPTARTGTATIASTGNIYEIGSCAFYDAAGVTDILIPNTVYIFRTSCFYGTSVTDLVIPYNSKFALQFESNSLNINGLQTVKIASKKKMPSFGFDCLPAGITLIVPTTMVSLYQSDSYIMSRGITIQGY